MNQENTGCQADRLDASMSRFQFGCLLAAALMEGLFLIMGSLMGYIMYYYVESWLVVPCVLFWGFTMARGVSRKTVHQLLPAVGMVGWFLLVQTQHEIAGMDTKPIGMFLCVYLLAFPFASVTGDGEREKGMKAAAWIFVAVAMTLVGYTALLMTDMVPAFLEPYVKWDGTRLNAMWHPNICACLFMIGIGLCFGFSFRTKKIWQKVLLYLACGLQFACLALTNGRTSALLTSGLVGGILFFAIWKGGWKRFLVGLAAALIVIPSLFLTSGRLYDWNSQRLLGRYQQECVSENPAETQTEMQAAPDMPAVPARTEEEPTEETTMPEPVPVLETENPQGTLATDMRTLNGRTVIWSSAAAILRDTPSLLVWGTEYVGTVISVYNPFPVEHAHNSWLEILFRMGLPGLIFALIFTGLAIWNALRVLLRHEDMFRSCVALLVLCLLAAGFLEPFLFCADITYQYLDFFFFLTLGYLTQWRRETYGG